ncbi:hypothetical protein [Pelagibacterium luteolum]|uniref:Uncharacterized protein n=1 Tax=Pelagibacterium luteolum TaxID=440168 RepID=A0A1G7YAD6_9HYPH|nr:hypothetical protein [Pelagibacterium luteolum]SDG93364.1 hypothetical protein SAMN04487974_11311 [Pelagibacterium luteolum]
MVEIMFAAHISQIEARHTSGPDWRHEPLRPAPIRIVIAMAVLIAAGVTLLPGLAPRSSSPQHFAVSTDR